MGTITDPNKAVVASATVTVTNTGTNISTSVHSNGSGDYTVTPLNPGTYEVDITAPGFRSAKISRVEVQVNQSVRADVQLQLGSTATTVQVTAAAPLLNTEEGALGTVVTNHEIVNLPLNGRSFYDLAKLTPGAALFRAAAICFASELTISRARPSAVFAAPKPRFSSTASTSLIIIRAAHLFRPPLTISRSSASCRMPTLPNSGRLAASST